MQPMQKDFPKLNALKTGFKKVMCTVIVVFYYYYCYYYCYYSTCNIPITRTRCNKPALRLGISPNIKIQMRLLGGVGVEGGGGTDQPFNLRLVIKVQGNS